MKPPSDTTSERVPLVTKFAFGAGDVGPATATAIMSFFMLYFFTDVARISPAIAECARALTDAVADVCADAAVLRLPMATNPANATAAKREARDMRYSSSAKKGNAYWTTLPSGWRPAERP